MTKNINKLNITIVISIIVISLVIFFKIPINLGLDLQGGSQLILEAKDTELIKVNNDTMLGAMEVIRGRIDGLGITEPVIQRKGQKQIVVELAGIDNPDRAIKIIGETAILEFVEAEWAPPNISELSQEKIDLLAGPDAKIDKVLFYDRGGRVINERPIFLKKSVLSGGDLTSATPGTDSYGNPVVNIEFSAEGTKKFREATSRGVGKPIAIILDKKIISAPNVNEPILTGRAQISGNFSVEEMSDLVIKLKAGALPVPVEVVYNKTVGPTLGKDSIAKSKLAGIIGFVLVIIFMFINYQLAGLTSGIALCIYPLLLIVCFKLLGATLTLPGIAGFILSIGMAVDANVLIYERIKDVMRTGQPFFSSIDAGFKKAFITILDTHATTLISCIALFWFGTGSIKGFAVTLTLGVIVNLFTAVFVSRLLLDGFAQIFVNKAKLILK